LANELGMGFGHKIIISEIRPFEKVIVPKLVNDR